MARLHVADLVRIVPAAARLESIGGEAAARIRSGIIELLAESCDVATLDGARRQLLEQVGERLDLREAEARLVDDAIRRAGGSPWPATAARATSR
ncbi:MAG TPA: hypothetical protein VF183_01920 [Acidimicrobiales bacterium]